MHRPIGLHLRRNNSLPMLLAQATQLEIPFFQCFLRQQSGLMINPSKEEITAFRIACKNYEQLYLHASYRINLADPDIDSHPALKQELYWAQKLGFTHMILHPGATSDSAAGIDAIARTLNVLIKHNCTIDFVLENVAFSAPSIGGNIMDLQRIREKLDQPDRLLFCLDTAHAYAFGYAINTQSGREEFMHTVEHTIGFDNIALIHANDTQSLLASYHDMHCRIGEGQIGAESLKQFILDPHLLHVPVLLEIPALEQAQEAQDLAIIRSWHT